MLDIQKVKLRTEEEIMSSWVNKEKIVVSVVCATYNQQRYIEDAITGFLMQETDFAFEVIIHDDASTDSTPSVVEKYQKLYPNIIKPIYQLENQYSKGDFRPSRYCVDFARGSFIAPCEGDDFWVEPSKLQYQYELLIAKEHIVVCGHNAFIVDERGNTLYSDRWKHNGKRELFSPTIMYKNIPFTPFFQECFNVVENGDTALLFYLASHGEAQLIDLNWAGYRVSDSGIWSKKSRITRLEMGKKTWHSLLRWSTKEYKRGVLPCYINSLNTSFKLMSTYAMKGSYNSSFNQIKFLIKLLLRTDISAKNKLKGCLLALRYSLPKQSKRRVI